MNKQPFPLYRSQERVNTFVGALGNPHETQLAAAHGYLIVSAPNSGHGFRMQLTARPGRSLIPTAIDQQLGLLLPDLPKVQQALADVAGDRSAAQLAAHERVREASRTKGRVSIKPVLPVDILGAYLLRPMPGTGDAS